MKKSFILVAALSLVSFLSNAQSFKDGDKLLNLGLGLGSPYFGSGYTSSLPVNPTITYEKGISNEISVGGTVSYASAKLKSYDLKYNAFYLGARGSYHFSSNVKTDLYGGAGLGYVVVSLADSEYGSYGAASGVGYSLFVGGRYYFTNATALYGELGYGSLSILNVGVTLKF